MNNTGLTLYIIPEDLPYFEQIADCDFEAEKFPGLLQITTDEFDPDDLRVFCDRMFFGGWGGYSGSYTAHSVSCMGEGDFLAHACDEDGALSLYAFDTFSPDADLLPEPAAYTIKYVKYADWVVMRMLAQANRSSSGKTKALISKFNGERVYERQVIELPDDYDGNPYGDKLPLVMHSNWKLTVLDADTTR